jgi:hypothetical protein
MSKQLFSIFSPTVRRVAGAAADLLRLPFKLEVRFDRHGSRILEVANSVVHLLAFVTIISTVGCDSHGAMKVDWKKFNDAREVEQYLNRSIPKNSKLEQVTSFATDQQLTCSSVKEGVMYCSALAPSKSNWLAAKWLIQFHFIDERLTEISVKLGLTGP